MQIMRSALRRTVASEIGAAVQRSRIRLVALRIPAALCTFDAKVHKQLPQTICARNFSNYGTETAQPLVYESPLGSVVAKLRAVSLITAVAGSTGVPCMLALKGGATPEVGMLAVALTFVAGTIGSTAAVTYVFRPYVYRIECVPLRVCSFQKERDEDGTASQEVELNGKNVLLKAVTKSLFLRQVDVVFDPETDVEIYKGLRPLCNFAAKGVPLYVHSEFVYDKKLRAAMKLDEPAILTAPKENPDDFL